MSAPTPEQVQKLRERIRSELTVYEVCVSHGITPNMNGAYAILAEALDVLTKIQDADQ